MVLISSISVAGAEEEVRATLSTQKQFHKMLVGFFFKWITHVHKILRKFFCLHFTSHSDFVTRTAVKDKSEFYHPE